MPIWQSPFHFLYIFWRLAAAVQPSFIFLVIIDAWMIPLYASKIYTKVLPAFGCPQTVYLWIKLVYQPTIRWTLMTLSSTGMVFWQSIWPHGAVCCFMQCAVLGCLCMFLNILLSGDLSTRLHDYYLDHLSQCQTIPAVIICHYTIKFLPFEKAAWRCLLLCAVCRSRVPSGVSKYSSIRRFKYVTSDYYLDH